MRNRSALLALTALCTACSDYTLQATPDNPLYGEPVVEVEPALLDFWTVPGDTTEVLSVEVRNVGAALLQVEDFEIVDDTGSFTLFDPPAALDLQPGESATLDVAFTPMSPEQTLGTVTMSTNDPEQPTPTVALVGAGRVGWLVVTPADYEFSDTRVSCPDSVSLTLQNVGDDDLVVDGMDYSSDGQLSLDSHLSLPLTLSAGGYTTVDVVLTPTAAGEIEGVLAVSSSDPRGLIQAVQRADPTAAESRTDTFTVPTDPPVDVLFAVDQSCSMDDDSERLAANFSTFIETLSAATGGWQIGVVTLDDGCFNGGILDADTDSLVEAFTDAVTLGEDAEIADDEALLKLSDQALQQTVSGACNEGFLREGALTHVVVVSDEPDRSTEQASAWTWDFWLDRMEAIAPYALKVSGVVDADDCSEGDAGYAEIIEATGGERLSICDDAWGHAAEALALASSEALFSFALSDAPDEDTIEVSVDGAAVTSGWEYDADLGAVVFAEGLESSAGSVEITYSVTSTCP